MRRYIVIALGLLLCSCGSSDSDSSGDGLDLFMGPPGQEVVVTGVAGTVEAGGSITCSVGEDICIPFSITNTGDAAINSGLRMTLNDGSSIRDLTTPEVLNGKTRVTTRYIYEVMPSSFGYTTFTLIVDSEDEIEETNEGNNSYTVSVTLVQATAN